MRKTLIAGNWKMNASQAMVSQLLTELLAGLSAAGLDAAAEQTPEIAVFPPFPYLQQTAALLGSSPIQWGGQTVSSEQSGAYTGQVALSMLQDFACQYVLIGHSERRQLNAETDDHCAQQFNRVMVDGNGIIPILCVGETLAEREADQAETVIQRQLQACLNNNHRDRKFVVAYEPVWAIGTGKTATAEQAQAMHALIRQTLAEINTNLAQTTQILYGGSVKPENAGELMALADVDGVLVGGCSLHSEQFLSIIEASIGCHT